VGTRSEDRRIVCKVCGYVRKGRKKTRVCYTCRPNEAELRRREEGRKRGPYRTPMPHGDEHYNFLSRQVESRLPLTPREAPEAMQNARDYLDDRAGIIPGNEKEEDDYEECQGEEDE
jgi:hypothetical protein